MGSYTAPVHQVRLRLPQFWTLFRAGFESLFWGRTDYQDMQLRTSPAGQANNQWPEWVWQGSQSLGKSAELFAGELTTGGYGAPIGWDQGKRHDIAAI